MSLKKTTASGVALQSLDTNQETLSLREVRSQNRNGTSPTLQEEELDQGPRNHSPAGAKEKGEDGPTVRPTEEDR
jgi:hypothetical protein